MKNKPTHDANGIELHYVGLTKNQWRKIHDIILEKHEVQLGKVGTVDLNDPVLVASARIMSEVFDADLDASLNNILLNAKK